MKVTILGTRGYIRPSAPHHMKHSGVLVDETLLFDLGEQEFIRYRPAAIFLTHLHPDHAYFIENGPLNTDTPIYAPENHQNCQNIQITHAAVSINNYRIIPIPTVHNRRVRSQGYIIEHQGKRILYTGDMIDIPNQCHHLIGTVDAVITEASYIHTNGRIRQDSRTDALSGHTGIPNLIQFFKQYTDTIIFMHFGSWFFHDMEKRKKDILDMAQQEDIRAIISHDGVTLTV